MTGVGVGIGVGLEVEVGVGVEVRVRQSLCTHVLGDLTYPDRAYKTNAALYLNALVACEVRIDIETANAVSRLDVIVVVVQAAQINALIVVLFQDRCLGFVRRRCLVRPSLSRGAYTSF